jgi:hypothetical protein
MAYLMTSIASFEISLIPGVPEEFKPPSIRVMVKLDNEAAYTVIRQWRPQKPFETELDIFWTAARDVIVDRMSRDDERKQHASDAGTDPAGTA